MKLAPIELYLRSLRVGKVRLGYVTREVAYDKLKQMTGLDFGLDVDKWREWYKGRKTKRVSDEEGDLDADS
jgi:hypothetical protein